MGGAVSRPFGVVMAAARLAYGQVIQGAPQGVTVAPSPAPVLGLGPLSWRVAKLPTTVHLTARARPQTKALWRSRQARGQLGKVAAGQVVPS
jgi:hypothetical protein